jgi:hypothetical protein
MTHNELYVLLAIVAVTILDWIGISVIRNLITFYNERGEEVGIRFWPLYWIGFLVYLIYSHLPPGMK